MSGQVRKWGAAATLNHISGEAVPFVGTSAPSSWIPGQYWVNTTGPVVSLYDGTSPYNSSHWYEVAPTPAAGKGLYLALLTANPDTSGSGGGPADSISDLVEDITSGYARQPITFSQITQSNATEEPAQTANTGNVTFGPYSANQLTPVPWAALVTVLTGNTGLLLYTWQLDTVEQVPVSDSIQIPAGDLVLDQE